MVRNVFRVPKRREEELIAILRKSFRVSWYEGGDAVFPRRTPANYPTEIKDWPRATPIPFAHICFGFDPGQRTTLEINQNYSALPRVAEQEADAMAPYQERVREIVEDFLH